MATYKNKNDGEIHAQSVHIGDIINHIVNGEMLAIPKRLTNFIPVDATHVVGRDVEVQATRDKLLTAKPTVLVNGIGGIGKTTLALKYMVNYTPQYQHLAWLNAASGVQSAFIGNDELLKALHIKAEVEQYVNTAQPNKAFDCVFKRLNDLNARDVITEKHTQNHPLSKNNILVVLDNANDLNDLLYYKKYFDTAHIHLLITSRALPLDWQVVNVEALPKEQALLFFRQTAPSVSATDAALYDLLEKLFYHTLLIELVAKAAKANALDFDRLHRAITDKFIHDPDLQKRKIDVAAHSETIGEEVKRAKIGEYIWLIFKNVKELPDQAREMLRAFALLPPATAFDEDFLTQHFAQWHITEGIYDNLDINLVERGWLDKDKTRYTMHPLIADVVVKHLEVGAEYAEDYIFKVAALIYCNDKKPNESISEKKQYEPITERLVKLFFDENTESMSYLLQSFNDYNRIFGQYRKAVYLGERALQIAENSTTMNETAVSICLSNLALGYEKIGYYTEAIALIKRALTIDKKIFGRNHPNIATLKSSLAMVYQKIGGYSEAANLLRFALAADKKRFGEEHPTIATRQSNLAVVYLNLKRYPEAANLLEKSLSINKIHFGENHLNITSCQSNLALAYKHLGLYNSAVDLLVESLKIVITHFGENHPEVAIRQSNLGMVYCDLKRYSEAKELLEKALASDEKNFGLEHSNVAIAQSNLASIYQDIGYEEEAKALYKKAYLVFLKTLGENHPSTQGTKRILNSYPSQ